MCRAWSSNGSSAELLRWVLVAAGLSGAVAVALGAFGAHALADVLDADARVVWETANQYHWVHTLALAVAALLPLAGVVRRLAAAIAAVWLAGIAVFSGSLYLLAVTGATWLGAVTPVGGVAFIGGWLGLVAAAGASPRS